MNTNASSVNETPPPIPSPAIERYYCMNCGQLMTSGASFCPHCGYPQTPAQPQPAPMPFQQMASYAPQQPTTIIVQEKNNSNAIGVIGFICSLVSILLCGVGGIGIFVWIFGFLFSLIGIFKKPRGFAIAGFIISLIDLLALFIILGAFMGAFMG